MDMAIASNHCETLGQPSRDINVLVSMLSGLSTYKTKVFVFPGITTLAAIRQTLLETLPINASDVYVRFRDNTVLSETDGRSLASLSNASTSGFIQLGLCTRLRGGKGGFGSQLRAAGGRMASKKKKREGDDNGSSRNLAGRRIRTVNEAKALAEYLAIKPEMARQEREDKRKRWEHILALTERKEEELARGSAAKVEDKFIDERDEANERTRNAVLSALDAGHKESDLDAALVNSEANPRLNPSTVAKPSSHITPNFSMAFDEFNESFSDSSDAEDTNILKT